MPPRLQGWFVTRRAMFSLLRNVRRNLLQKKSLGTYALYAVGEVILIVAGILAALWIDNWNQERQEKEREQFYLSGLQAEFTASLAKLDTLIAVNRSSYGTAEALLELIPRVESEDKERTVSQMLVRTLSYELAYNPNNSLLEELISSGRLETLTDRELRYHLTSWKSFVESVHRQEQSLRSEREHVADLLRGPEGSIQTIMVHTGVAPPPAGGERLHSNLPLLKSVVFENNFLLFVITAKDTENNLYLPLRTEIESILKLIAAGLE